MISTGTSSERTTTHGEFTAARRAFAVFSLVAIVLSPLGCSSETIRSSRRVATPGFAPESSLTGSAPAPTGPGVIRIEPDPVRDSQVEVLLKSALDDLRSGSIQQALDLLTQAQGVEGWMRSEHAPAVLFWTGHAYDQLDERNAAMAAFRRITLQYPRSAFADRATRRLRELRSRSTQPKR